MDPSHKLQQTLLTSNGSAKKSPVRFMIRARPYRMMKR